ncbi:8-amino-7-oxononanoate synthase [Candidatus Manganitrophus noduliformans]|uniref:8-amino-7-ketopelargonate synthase n=1 Tax=Candidatus Manganitrophus noduliformans TaxID=2606439 RepID=A0A7X6ID91_9BACT|nr:8-amino-7-oxononanoate synthase [Candidatus Manganitrophus noduliformans]NKE73194.1 8-amino-7-oxononanoate synthase [Candidatus Manganitrophus noduliformans]
MFNFQKEISFLSKHHLIRTLVPIDSGQATTLKQNGKSFLHFSSNNYLGLAGHPTLKSTAIRAVEEWGVGGGASRLVSGNSRLYFELETKIAKFKNTASALVFPSGYAANIGAIGALVQKQDLIFADRLCHASLIDGARLSGATLRVYRHKDTEQLAKLLRQKKKKGQTLIITDGVFSMDGDIAPLAEILRLAEEFDALIYLDDAHATGVLGPNGRGTCDYFALSSPRIIQMGTLSKALGGLGGFIAADRVLIEYLINKARPFIYTTALPPVLLATALAGFELIESDPEIRNRLWRLTSRVRTQINQMGFNTCGSETPIIPILIGPTETALTFSQKLLEEGIYIPAIRPPTVPDGTSRLRISLMATHTDEQIQLLLNSLKHIGKKLRLI